MRSALEPLEQAGLAGGEDSVAFDPSRFYQKEKQRRGEVSGSGLHCFVDSIDFS